MRTLDCIAFSLSTLMAIAACGGEKSGWAADRTASDGQSSFRSESSDSSPEVVNGDDLDDRSVGNEDSESVSPGPELQASPLTSISSPVELQQARATSGSVSLPPSFAVPFAILGLPLPETSSTQR